MNVLIIDNYDSFTYNLVYIIRKSTNRITVFRNDKIAPEDCLKYDAIILSPGPGLPKNAGALASIICTCAGLVPILGVCLGHQAIAEYLGGDLYMAKNVFHGVQTPVRLTRQSHEIFKNIPEVFQAGRYHSWAVNSTTTSDFEVTAYSQEGTVMAIQNTDKHLFGIQFHPESILTPEGEIIIQNFIRICNDQKR